jgi:hypothetical protein
MANSILEQLIETARLLRPMLGELAFVQGYRALLSMWTQSLRSIHMRNTGRLANGFARLNFARTPVKDRPSADGSTGEPSSISCLLMKDSRVFESLVSPYHGYREDLPALSGSRNPGGDRTTLLGY